MRPYRPYRPRRGSYSETALEIARTRGRVCTADVAAWYGAVAPSYRYATISTVVRRLVSRGVLVFHSREGKREYFCIASELLLSA